MKGINNESGYHRRLGTSYMIIEEEILMFNNLGYLTLRDVLSEAELQTIDPWFDHFINGKEMEHMGRDFCDMSQPYGTPVEEFQLINAMLPSFYRHEFAGNIFQKVSRSIAEQLYKNGHPDMDYEQFLAKKPTKSKAEFAMHQDLGYWPKKPKIHGLLPFLWLLMMRE